MNFNKTWWYGNYATNPEKDAKKDIFFCNKLRVKKMKTK